jgi:hypothetical protein
MTGFAWSLNGLKVQGFDFNLIQKLGELKRSIENAF